MQLTHARPLRTHTYTSTHPQPPTHAVMIGGWLFCGLYLLHQKWWFLALCLGAFTFAAASSSFVLVGKGAMYPPMIVAAFVVCVSFATPQAAVSATLVKTVGIAGGILVSAMLGARAVGQDGPAVSRRRHSIDMRSVCTPCATSFPSPDRPSCLFPPCRRCTHTQRARAPTGLHALLDAALPAQRLAAGAHRVDVCALTAAPGEIGLCGTDA